MMKDPFVLRLLAIFLGFLVDCVLGDPAGLPHPVIFIGKLISCSEKTLRKLFPKTHRGEFFAGAVMAIFVPVISAAVPFGILFLCRKVSIWLSFAVSVVMCWQIFAARCLRDEALKVVAALKQGGLLAGRKQVSMLVGRDTQELSEEQVLKAAVETVAENTTDGVISPLLFMMLAGPCGGFFYKAVNTMDSMVGYKNEKYLWFGRAAARLDDAANFIPARIAAAAMIAAAALAGMDAKNAARIFIRDRKKSTSPNAGQTESACAGALHIELLGDAYYFGKLVKKPPVGDPDRRIERADVKRSCILMYGTSILLLMICEAAGALALLLLY